MRDRRSFFILLVMIFCSSPLLADEVLPPASTRFSDSSGEEQPSLRRHVLPLLGRLGCNGRACHGSFQGQGGFRLSMFGFDFAADHAALTGGDNPRINRSAPVASLILVKPTSEDDHGGGLRYSRDGWEYRMLRTWIEAGAPNNSQPRVKL